MQCVYEEIHMLVSLLLESWREHRCPYWPLSCAKAKHLYVLRHNSSSLTGQVPLVDAG